jgi:hypothetical protein
MSATELIEHLRALSAKEREAFARLFHELEKPAIPAAEAPNLSELHAEIMRDIPLRGPTQKTNLAAWHDEDEE